ncbi:hypothetical protein Hanom_Chr03g00221311 [Helianthus anomalus]
MKHNCTLGRVSLSFRRLNYFSAPFWVIEAPSRISKPFADLSNDDNNMRKKHNNIVY